MNIKSKGKVLLDLVGKTKLFHIPKLICFDTGKWHKSDLLIFEELTAHFQNENDDITFAIRSSAGDEDGLHSAKAGEYESVLNVPYERYEISNAIEKVIDSYSKRKSKTLKDEIIIQKMVINPIMSGVVFTKDLNSGAPYYVINYDDVTGKTDTVTAGESEYSNRTLYVLRSAIKNVRSERFKALLSAVEELEDILDYDCLDIEFAMDQNLKPYLLQVRPITTSSTWDPDIEMKLNKSLEDIHTFVSKRLKPMDGVFGETTVLGQMPDWNPVEMIGRSPKQLSYSIYEKLITKHAWRIAREQMGYLTPEGKHLMIDLGGQPYIDTRLSFHSYLPGGLPSRISEKLVNKWVKNL